MPEAHLSAARLALTLILTPVPAAAQSSGPGPAVPPEGPAPPTPPTTEYTAGTTGDAAETRLDETTGVPAGVAPRGAADDGFCVECVLIGAGVGVTILGIPFIAISEIARNRKESLDAWVKTQGDADLGFAPGYGFAKADDEQERYLVAGLVVTGLGVATLLTTIIVAASRGGAGGGGLFTVEGPSSFELVPAVGADLGGIAARARY